MVATVMGKMTCRYKINVYWSEKNNKSLPLTFIEENNQTPLGIEYETYGQTDRLTDRQTYLSY